MSEPRYRQSMLSMLLTAGRISRYEYDAIKAEAASPAALDVEGVWAHVAIEPETEEPITLSAEDADEANRALSIAGSRMRLTRLWIQPGARLTAEQEPPRHHPKDNCGDPEHDAILAAWYERATAMLDRLEAANAGLELNGIEEERDRLTDTHRREAARCTPTR